jgi:hypothetical protein
MATGIDLPGMLKQIHAYTMYPEVGRVVAHPFMGAGGLGGTFNNSSKELTLYGTESRPSEELTRTMLHEIGHAGNRMAINKPGPGGSWQRFVDDQAAIDGGYTARSKAPDLGRKVMYDAQDLKMASTGHTQGEALFEEVRATAYAYVAGKKLGIPVDSETATQVETLFAKNPEFKYWMEKDLGGRYLAEDRLKESPVDITSIIRSLNPFK